MSKLVTELANLITIYLQNIFYFKIWYKKVNNKGVEIKNHMNSISVWQNRKSINTKQDFLK